MESYDPVYKVNPPLRTDADVQALRIGLADGTIDIVATDHAPHPTEDKECEWSAAAFGMIGLETAFGVIVKTMIETGAMSWPRLVEVMSTNPAKIGRYSRQGGTVTAGSPANLTLVNPKSAWQVDREKMSSKSKNTPFHGTALTAKVIHTIYEGVFVVKNETLTGLKHE